MRSNRARSLDSSSTHFDSDEAEKSGSQDALARLVSQVCVKLTKLGEEGLQPDSLSKEKINNLL